MIPKVTGKLYEVKGKPILASTMRYLRPNVHVDRDRIAAIWA